MKVSPDDLIAGVTARWLRGVLCDVAPEFTFSEFSYWAELDELAAHRLLTDLVALGYLERLRSSGFGYGVTVPGAALRNASFRKRTSRKIAEVRLAEFLERVEVVNADDAWPYRIDAVRMFGSMLDPDVSHVGDIDLVVERSHRADDLHDAFWHECAFVDAAVAAGRDFRTYAQQAAWPEVAMLRFLRARNGLFSLISPSDGILRTVELRELYRRPGFERAV